MAFLAALSIDDPTRFERGAADAGAFVPKLLGDETPAKRLERANRVDKRKKR